MTKQHSELAKKACVPCQGGTPPLNFDHIQILLTKLGGGWDVIGAHHLQKEYKFKNFKETMLFVNAVAAIAQREGHHPDMHVSYDKVRLQIWTHKINGLTESDFILAAKCDQTV